MILTRGASSSRLEMAIGAPAPSALRACDACDRVRQIPSTSPSRSRSHDLVYLGAHDDDEQRAERGVEAPAERRGRDEHEDDAVAEEPLDALAVALREPRVDEPDAVAERLAQRVVLDAAASGEEAAPPRGLFRWEW